MEALSASLHKVKGLGIGNDYRQWNLLREDVSLPTAILLSENIEHNLHWMQTFIDKYRVKLAPHGKTTMSPKLFHKQLEHGAWAITLATVNQVQVAQAAGIHRVLMANQLVGKTNILIIRRLLDENPDFDFYCLVDSEENVQQLSQYFPSEKGRRLQVLLEIGVDQGRTGVRSEHDEQALVDSIEQQKHAIELAGVELYEGVLNNEQGVRAMLKRTVASLHRLATSNRLSRQPPILSGAGSSWYDIVAEEFAQISFPVDILLRPGCYVSHDLGVYHQSQIRILQQNTIAQEISAEGGLKPALQIWAYVQSIPETKRAIIAFGKRDAAFDAGFPLPILHYRFGWLEPKSIDEQQYTITKMMDQHAFLDCPIEHELHVGDMIGFNISHPCLTFDKWRNLLLVDRDYNVIDIIETQF